MAYPKYIREKAREMRLERRMTLDEIAERLAISRSTVWYWIRDIEIHIERKRPEPPHLPDARKKAGAVNRAKHMALREAAYGQGRSEFDALARQPGFQDFICMYIGEGYKRRRHTVAIANSDPKVLRLANHWLRQLTEKDLIYSVQYHADQDPEYLRDFWSQTIGFDSASFRLQRKSNSNQLNGRTWRSRWGVLTITVHDTYLRARMQAWMDCVQAEWDVNSSSLGV